MKHFSHEVRIPSSAKSWCCQDPEHLDRRTPTKQNVNVKTSPSKCANTCQEEFYSPWLHCCLLLTCFCVKRRELCFSASAAANIIQWELFFWGACVWSLFCVMLSPPSCTPNACFLSEMSGFPSWLIWTTAKVTVAGDLQFIQGSSSIGCLVTAVVTHTFCPSKITVGRAKQARSCEFRMRETGLSWLKLHMHVSVLHFEAQLG